jgi:class 3 adenylate cyclase
MTGSLATALTTLSILFVTAWVYGFLAIWRNDVAWLRRIQRTLIQAGALPPEHRFIRNVAPWRVEKTAAGIFAEAVNRNRKIQLESAGTHQALEAYLGHQGSAHASQSGDLMTGNLRRLYILFCDLRGFTAMSEKLTPGQTVQVLNQIYTVLEAVLAEGGGEINKYIGDAILTYFKRPEGNEAESAARVARTAQALHAKFQENLVNLSLLHIKGIKLGLGVGVVAGEAILGDLGSRNRHEYTLIGDSVNLASRLCGVAPAGEVLMDETMAICVSDTFMVESRLPLQLKGKSEKVTPYCLMDELKNFHRPGAK